MKISFMQINWHFQFQLAFLNIFQAWIVERMGKFHRILEPGLNLLWPIVDKIKYVQSLKEIAIDVPKQSAITSDNVTLSIDGVLYLRIIDPYLGMIDPCSSFGSVFSVKYSPWFVLSQELLDQVGYKVVPILMHVMTFTSHVIYTYTPNFQLLFIFVEILLQVVTILNLIFMLVITESVGNYSQCIVPI